jgi:hypothetical protein
VQVPFGCHPTSLQVDERRRFLAEAFAPLKLKRLDFAIRAQPPGPDMSPLHKIEKPDLLTNVLPRIQQRNILATKLAPTGWLLGTGYPVQ